MRVFTELEYLNLNQVQAIALGFLNWFPQLILACFYAPHPNRLHYTMADAGVFIKLEYLIYSPVSNIGDIRSLEEGSDEGSIVLDADEVGLDTFLEQFV